jgi:hypothetical protein
LELKNQRFPVFYAFFAFPPTGKQNCNYRETAKIVGNEQGIAGVTGKGISGRAVVGLRIE